MSETLEPMANEVDQKQLAEQLLAQAKEQGVDLIGPNGLLNQLTKNVLETALDAEMFPEDSVQGIRTPRSNHISSRNGNAGRPVSTRSNCP